jgi:hypothetical protein
MHLPSNIVSFPKYAFIFFIALCALPISATGQSECRSKVGEYITRFKAALQNFIPDPGTDEDRNRYLESLRQTNVQLYNSVEQLSLEAKTNSERDTLWLPCFQQEFLNIDPGPMDGNIILWSAHLFKRFTAFDFESPEFERGIGIHVDANQGAADLGRDSEAYSFAARILLAYTFSKSVSGGRFRILGGVSTYYFDKDFLWFVNPRVEYRIRDIGNELTSFGNIKAILDANFGETWIAGAGIGVELHKFGVQLMYQRQGETKKSHILVGLFYRFLK